MIVPGMWEPSDPIEKLFAPTLRWAMRQEGAGSQRFLSETLARYHIDPSNLRTAARAYSEREAPGARGAAAEFGLDFHPIGWEAYDFALYRGVYFRALFRKLLEHLQGAECQRLAQLLGGYDFSNTGELVWSEST